MGLFDNLFYNSNKKRWLETKASDNTTKYLKEVINKFFIPDNIDVDKYVENQKANDIVNNVGSLKGFELANALSAVKKTIRCTPSFRNDYVQDSTNRTTGTPNWFYIGYPDVVVWMQFNTLRLEKEFEARENDFVDKDGLNFYFYRTMIEKYKAENGELECTA